MDTSETSSSRNTTKIRSATDHPRPSRRPKAIQQDAATSCSVSGVNVHFELKEKRQQIHDIGTGLPSSSMSLLNNTPSNVIASPLEELYALFVAYGTVSHFDHSREQEPRKDTAWKGTVRLSKISAGSRLVEEYNGRHLYLGTKSYTLKLSMAELPCQSVSYTLRLCNALDIESVCIGHIAGSVVQMGTIQTIRMSTSEDLVSVDVSFTRGSSAALLLEQYEQHRRSKTEVAMYKLSSSSSELQLIKAEVVDVSATPLSSSPHSSRQQQKDGSVKRIRPITPVDAVPDSSPQEAKVESGKASTQLKRSKRLEDVSPERDSTRTKTVRQEEILACTPTKQKQKEVPTILTEHGGSGSNLSDSKRTKPIKVTRNSDIVEGANETVKDSLTSCKAPKTGPKEAECNISTAKPLKCNDKVNLNSTKKLQHTKAEKSISDVKKARHIAGTNRAHKTKTNEDQTDESPKFAKPSTSPGVETKSKVATLVEKPTTVVENETGRDIVSSQSRGSQTKRQRTFVKSNRVARTHSNSDTATSTADDLQINPVSLLVSHTRHCNKGSMYDFISQADGVMRIEVKISPQTNQPQGFTIVQMTNQKSATNAKSLWDGMSFPEGSSSQLNVMQLEEGALFSSRKRRTVMEEASHGIRCNPAQEQFQLSLEKLHLEGTKRAVERVDAPEIPPELEKEAASPSKVDDPPRPSTEPLHSAKELSVEYGSELHMRGNKRRPEFNRDENSLPSTKVVMEQSTTLSNAPRNTGLSTDNPTGGAQSRDPDGVGPSSKIRRGTVGASAMMDSQDVTKSESADELAENFQSVVGIGRNGGIPASPVRHPPQDHTPPMGPYTPSQPSAQHVPAPAPYSAHSPGQFHSPPYRPYPRPGFPQNIIYSAHGSPGYAPPHEVLHVGYPGPAFNPYAPASGHAPPAEDYSRQLAWSPPAHLHQGYPPHFYPGGAWPYQRHAREYTVSNSPAPAPPGTSGSSEMPPLLAPKSDETASIVKSRLYVSFPQPIPEEALRSAMEAAAPGLEYISKHEGKLYAFVKYCSEESANTAMRKLNGFVVDGKLLKVAIAQPPPSRKRLRPSENNSTSVRNTSD